MQKLVTIIITRVKNILFWCHVESVLVTILQVTLIGFKTEKVSYFCDCTVTIILSAVHSLSITFFLIFLGGLIPLHNACSFGHAEVVRILLRHGADPNSRDNWNYTPLHEAAVKGKVDVCVGR